jgi:hypothetical protein
LYLCGGEYEYDDDDDDDDAKLNSCIMYGFKLEKVYA